MGGKGVGGIGHNPQPLIQLVPDMLDEIWSLRWLCQNTDNHVLQEISHRMTSIASGIVMLESRVRMSLQKECNMTKENVFPVMHSVVIACSDSKSSDLWCDGIQPQSMTEPLPPNRPRSRVNSASDVMSTNYWLNIWCITDSTLSVMHLTLCNFEQSWMIAAFQFAQTWFLSHAVISHNCHNDRLNFNQDAQKMNTEENSHRVWHRAAQYWKIWYSIFLR